MPCPYCAAFGRDLFGPTPPAGSAAEGIFSHGPCPARGGAAGDVRASRSGVPPWPVGFRLIPSVGEAPHAGAIR